MTTTVSLPLASTSFIGREAELVELRELLADPAKRLITLVGPGGSGKTRLAVEAARQASEPGTEIRFADLEAIEDVRDLALGIADALDLRLAGPSDPNDLLVAAASSASGMLVLDNFEHLIEGAGLVARLVETAPALRMLVTSRVALGVSAEWVFPVPGLSVPEPNQPVVSSIPSVQLFIERASRRNVRLPSGELDAIATICRTVEGNPLAIELAASWARTLSIEDIAGEVTRRLPTLESQLRSVPERHRSVLACFERSWSLLDETDREILVRMAAFEGGFSRDAAMGPIGASLPRLAGLVDKSLVQPRGQGRYGLHEVVRQCVLEHAGGGELPEDARERHLHYVADVVAARATAVRSHQQLEACEVLDGEMGNIRAAISYALRTGNSPQLKRITESVDYFLVVRGRHREALDLAERMIEARERLSDDPQLIADAYSGRGWARMRFAQLAAAEEDFKASQAIYDATGLRPAASLADDPLGGFALVALTSGDYERAFEYANQLLANKEIDGDVIGGAFALYLLGNVAYSQGDIEAADRYSREGLRRTLAYGDQWFAAYLQTDLARNALDAGHTDEAERHAQTAFETRKQFGDSEGMALALLQLSSVAIERNDLERAERLARESLVLYTTIGDLGGIVRAQSNLTTVAARSGDVETAVERALRAIEALADIAIVPIHLEVLTSVAEVFARPGDASSSLELLQVVLRQEEAAYATRLRAGRLVDSLDLPPRTVAEAKRRAERLTLPMALQAAHQALRAMTVTASGGAQDIVPGEPLTPRERAVLEMLGRGASNAEVAQRLGIAAGTVKWYTTQLYDKLGVRNRTEAVTAARARGLVG